MVSISEDAKSDETTWLKMPEFGIICSFSQKVCMREQNQRAYNQLHKHKIQATLLHAKIQNVSQIISIYILRSLLVPTGHLWIFPECYDVSSQQQMKAQLNVSYLQPLQWWGVVVLDDDPTFLHLWAWDNPGDFWCYFICCWRNIDWGAGIWDCHRRQANFQRAWPLAGYFTDLHLSIR